MSKNRLVHYTSQISYPKIIILRKKASLIRVVAQKKSTKTSFQIKSILDNWYGLSYLIEIWKIFVQF